MQSLIKNTVAIRSSVRALTAAVPAMNFATKPLDGKEKGDEKNYFNKEDEKVLKNLLKKMSAQAKAAEQAPEEVQKSEAALQKLFKQHKLEENKEFFNALLEWKNKI